MSDLGRQLEIVTAALTDSENQEARLRAALTAAQERERVLVAIVDEQAKNEALWCIPDNIVEALFQQELRRLHAAIEGKSPDECARAALSVAGAEHRHPGRPGSPQAMPTAMNRSPGSDCLPAAGESDPHTEPGLGSWFSKSKCPECNGKGEVADYVGLEMRPVGVECPTCGGTGCLPAAGDVQGEKR